MKLPLFVNSVAGKSIGVALEGGTWRLSSDSDYSFLLIVDNVEKETLKHNATFILPAQSVISLRVTGDILKKHSTSVHKWDSQVPN